MNERRAAPPQLMFDDGSRVMSEQQASSASNIVSPRGSVPIEVYFEVQRLAKEILDLKILPRDGWMCRVALQFPDNLLNDAPDVSWAMEDALTAHAGDEGPPPLVFILGDSTFGPCCLDEVSALHLEADVLVHYGHACLSPALSLPVIYSFGITDMKVDECVDRVLEEAKRESVRNFLLLYEVRYHHTIKELQAKLSERGDLLVLAGRIPQPSDNVVHSEESTCCQSSEGNGEAEKPKTFVVGGLELPDDVDLSSYTVLFVGDEGSCSRQYVNTMLRFLSLSSGPSRHWTYSPATLALATSLPSSVQRQLNRRFYLTQKARDASVYGILVGTLSQRHFRSVVSCLRSVIEDAGKSCYTFAVGKINGAKLANFGEIDCFVLVACGENSLLDNERELHVPVITPLELDIALGNLEWGSTAYSLDYNDFLSIQQDRPAQDDTAGDVDAPYFSLVTGKYVDFKKTSAADSDVDLTVLPGKGQVAAYKSEAADYLKHREYQGLEVNIGKNQVHAALPGQSGVASDYGNR